MRVVLKISGESLKDEQNISDLALRKIKKEIEDIALNNELLVVVGGGNFWRGRNKLDIDNDTSDYIGMLATCMNALALESYLNKNGIPATTNGAFDIEGIIQKKDKAEVLEALKNRIVILGGGIGLPNYSTDTATVKAAIAYDADLILMSKNIDGIYDKDPKEEGAKKIDKLSHDELLEMSIKQGKDSFLVMDFEAITELVKHKIPLYLYNNNEINNIDEVINGNKGTKVVS